MPARLLASGQPVTAATRHDGSQSNRAAARQAFGHESNAWHRCANALQHTAQLNELCGTWALCYAPPMKFWQFDRAQKAAPALPQLWTPWHATLAMVVTVASANYLNQFALSDWLTCGTPVIACTFLLTELTQRAFGPDLARRVVFTGFLMALMVSACLAPWRIAAASAVAFLMAQLTDILIFSRLRRARWWLGPIAASSVASALDTALFFFVAFAGTGAAWWQLGTGDLMCKLLVDVCLLLPFRLASRGLPQVSPACQTPHPVGRG